MPLNLDPSKQMERASYLQFKACLPSLIQQKLAKKGGASVDWQNDIQLLWYFYLEYKSLCYGWVNDDMQHEPKDSGNQELLVLRTEASSCRSRPSLSSRNEE
ncbi:hypothetical protein PVAP13_4KG017500 [Panicum virgatum]|uniref:Uncharacterized protein n=1 Tax=Panicum virgatum TaxID=38727 RepID=A0A8T0TJW5_PANVG|nr:hypothetical protein PVAP13_4KG017500 [Panicum virgatum]